MYSVLLDTSAYIEIRRANQTFLNLVTTATSVAIDPVALGELKAGFQRSLKPTQERDWLTQFLISERVRVLTVDHATADRYATLKTYLDGIGRPISPNDIWIASVAWQHGLHLLTADRHFLQLPQILTIFHPPL